MAGNKLKAKKVNKLASIDLAVQPKKPVPEFSAEDLDIDSASKFRSDEARELRVEIDKIYQIMHDKGLAVGLPSIILYDINAIVSILDRMKNVWADEQLAIKESEADDNIVKKLNKGDEYMAYHERTMQVHRLREERIKMATFLSVLREKMKLLQDRLIGKDLGAMER